MSKQPKFTSDELVLMLDLYLDEKAGVSRNVKDLCATLQALPIHTYRGDEAVFRNENGVRKALGYIRQIDQANGDWPWRPHFKDVWRAFAKRPEALKPRVAAVLADPKAALEVEEPDLDQGHVEGRAFYALHRRRERSAEAARRKREAPAICEVCGFDFEERYGEHGHGYIECHHIAPLAVTGPTTTKLEDLALVCANCHRMLHRGAPPPTVDELKAVVLA
jgi:5-methylcytosine-specific restriction enzyme A